MHSYFKPGQDLTGYYWDAALLPPVLNPGGRKYLFLGVGGGTAPGLVSRYFPDITLTGVEIDPVILEAGRLYFEMDRVPMKVVVADARLYLLNSGESYDFMMVDVYRDNRSIPFHLATREFFELVQDRLAPNGVLLMNVSCVEGGEPLFEAISATVASVFPYTGYLKVRGGACELFASRHPLDLLGGPLPPLPASFQAIARDDRSRIEILSALSAH